jgi:hypothetical protein
MELLGLLIFLEFVHRPVFKIQRFGNWICWRLHVWGTYFQDSQNLTLSLYDCNVGPFAKCWTVSGDRKPCCTWRWKFARMWCRAVWCPDGGDSTNLWNVGLLWRNYKALHPRKLSCSYAAPWEPEVSHYFSWFCPANLTGVALTTRGQIHHWQAACDRRSCLLRATLPARTCYVQSRRGSAVSTPSFLLHLCLRSLLAFRFSCSLFLLP